MGYLSPPPDPAPVVVVRDIGGVVADYQRQTEVYRRQNREVRLRECRSACTLALSLPKVCVYRSSVLRFHQAYDRNTKEIDHRISDQLFRSYPAAVRARLGYLTRKYKSLSGVELIRLGLRDCDAPERREPQIMIAKGRAPEYVPPGQGPVARFLSRVAGNLFGSSAQRKPEANRARPARLQSETPKQQLRVIARVNGLPAFGPNPPVRPVEFVGEPLQLGPAVAVRRAFAKTTSPPLPKIITGAWPVLPAGLTAYAPLQGLLRRQP